MELYEAIERRRTVRDFSADDVADEAIERIIMAAMKAPTNDHMRDWHYIAVRDKGTVLKLLSAIPKGISEEDMNRLIADWSLNDPEQQECYRSAVPKQYRMLANASVLIIPLLKQKTNILRPENQSALNGFASIWCSIENLFLAATAEGLGCSMRIPLGDEDKHARQTLGFPDDYFMPCFIGIGKPKDGAAPIKQKEIEVGTRIHKDKW
jgi:nitroreductase